MLYHPNIYVTERIPTMNQSFLSRPATIHFKPVPVFHNDVVSQRTDVLRNSSEITSVLPENKYFLCKSCRCYLADSSLVSLHVSFKSVFLFILINFLR